MVRKTMKLTSLFRTKRGAPKLLHPCPFLPYGAQPNTLSFRKANHVSCNPSQTLQSNRFTTSSSSVKSDLLDYCNNGDREYSLEELVRGVVRSSERLFFEPNGDTSSLLVMADQAPATHRADSTTDEGSKFQPQTTDRRKLKGKEKVIVDDDDDDDACEASFCESSVFMVLYSNDPYEDFKKSLEEMVEFHGVKDWEKLEELLSCYLIVNDKRNHEFIMRMMCAIFVSDETVVYKQCLAHSYDEYSQHKEDAEKYKAIKSFHLRYLLQVRVQVLVPRGSCPSLESSFMLCIASFRFSFYMF